MISALYWLLGWREWPLHVAVEAGSAEALAAALLVNADDMNAIRTGWRFGNLFYGDTALSLAIKSSRADPTPFDEFGVLLFWT